MHLSRRVRSHLRRTYVSVETPLYGETPFAIGDLATAYEGAARWAEDQLAQRVGRLAGQGVVTGWRRRVGVPHEEIVKAAAEEHAMYIVMGTHGRGGVGRFMLGSVADRVIRSAGCAVVVVRPREASRAA